MSLLETPTDMINGNYKTFPPADEQEDTPMLDRLKAIRRSSSKVQPEKEITSSGNDSNEDAVEAQQEKAKVSFWNYPKGVYFCLGNEFAERFSFYGMRAILTIYLISIHSMPDHEAKLIFHAFVSLAYFTPILGSILADGFLGRYRVILYISILYVLGHVLLTVGAVPTLARDILQILDFLGLFIIAVATGGIKPCVSAFAADQFPPTMVNERKQFFSFFYFSINLGALISKIVTPYLRGRVQCFGNDSCFPLAFGVPAIFMLIALIIFVCGKPFYKIVRCEENIIWKVCKCCFYALTKYAKSPKSRWLDYAVPKFGKQLVEDIRGLGVILVLFLPVIPFWALFDQMGSTWVLQANRMDGRIGYLTVLPDQMSVLNPILVILLVPLFEMVIYPVLTKWNCLVKPLRRMGWGGLLAATSFIIAGFLQIAVNKTLVHPPTNGEIHYSLANLGSCQLQIFSNRENITLAKQEDVSGDFSGALTVEFICPSGAKKLVAVNNSWSRPQWGQLLTFWDNHEKQEYHDYSHLPFELNKTKSGYTRLYVQLSPELYAKNASVQISQNGEVKFQQKYGSTFIDIKPALIGSNLYDIKLKIANDTVAITSGFLAQAGAAHGLIVYGNISYKIIDLVQPNSISLMWQIPQYIIITIGEILFSISGLEFSYSQAAPSMKSVLQAIWLMTVAFGNVLDMIISGSDVIENPAVEFFVYAGLMFVVMAVFVFLAYRYKYVDRDHEEEKNTESSYVKPPMLQYQSVIHNTSGEQETKT